MILLMFFVYTFILGLRFLKIQERTKNLRVTENLPPRLWIEYSQFAS